MSIHDRIGFEQAATSFSVASFRSRLAAVDLKQRILSLVDGQGVRCRAEIMAAMPASTSEASVGRAIRALVDEGSLVRVGHGRYAAATAARPSVEDVVNSAWGGVVRAVELDSIVDTPIGPAQFAIHLGVSRARASRVLQRLCAEGLLERRNSPLLRGGAAYVRVGERPRAVDGGPTSLRVAAAVPAGALVRLEDAAGAAGVTVEEAMRLLPATPCLGYVSFHGLRLVYRTTGAPATGEERREAPAVEGLEARIGRHNAACLRRLSASEGVSVDAATADLFLNGGYPPVATAKAVGWLASKGLVELRRTPRPARASLTHLGRLVAAAL